MIPPNPPAGWMIPPWLQIVAVIAFISTPFVNVGLTTWKERRGQTAQNGQALVDDQKGYIDTLLSAAAQVPELLQNLKDALRANIALEGEIQGLKGEIGELKRRVQHLEEERDMWRRQAERVPQLEGQIETLTRLLDAKHAELLAAQVKLQQLESGC